MVIEKSWVISLKNNEKFDVESWSAKGSENDIVASLIALIDIVALKLFLLHNGGLPEYPWLHLQDLFDWRVAFCVQDKQSLEYGPSQLKHVESQGKQL